MACFHTQLWTALKIQIHHGRPVPQSVWNTPKVALNKTFVHFEVFAGSQGNTASQGARWRADYTLDGFDKHSHFTNAAVNNVGFTAGSTRAFWTRWNTCVFKQQSFLVTFCSAAHPKHGASLLAWVKLKKTFRSLWRKRKAGPQHKEITIHTPAP